MLRLVERVCTVRSEPFEEASHKVRRELNLGNGMSKE